MITWTTGTPTYYPESWFWLNHQEDVMALTYEDWNSDLAGNFDSTANAMLRGIADYLDIEPSGIDARGIMVKNFELHQNYPNPFNPRTIINYELPITNYVDFSIYNSLGQKVVTLASEKQNAGSHQLEWDATGFASGLYYYQLRADDFVDVKKMILLR
jgi:hypothetical protein